MGEGDVTVAPEAGTQLFAKGLDARFRGHERSLGYAPSFSASSTKLPTAMSTGTVGLGSPLPGPCSFGRATCAVFSPVAAAAARSPECAATITTSCGLQ